MAYKGTKDNMSPDGVRQVQETTFQGAYQLWERLGERVSETPTPQDDALYYLANIPVKILTGHMEELGFKVVRDEEVDSTDTEAGSAGAD
jgi:hypothetical protein